MDQSIVSFLIRAKQATYAGKGAETDSSRIGSHDLVYRENNLMYYDTYLGGDKFAGEEALWISDIPYWSMNYIGSRFRMPSYCRSRLRNGLHSLLCRHPQRFSRLPISQVLLRVTMACL